MSSCDEALFVVEIEKVESGVETSLDYIVASKPAWATGDLVSKEETIKHQQTKSIHELPGVQRGRIIIHS